MNSILNNIFAGILEECDLNKEALIYIYSSLTSIAKRTAILIAQVLLSP